MRLHKMAYSSTCSSLKQVDLDILVEEFNSWQKYTMDKSRENVLLQEKIELINKSLLANGEREKTLKQELQDLKTMVNKLQGILAKRCDMEEDNRLLKEEVKSLKQNLQDQTKKHKHQMDEQQAERQELQKVHKAELKNLRASLQQKADLEKGLLEQTISDKVHQVEQLQQKMKEQERERQAEIVKLRLEYDAKLLKLQKQNTKTQQAAQGSNTSQDIFRKKLQHVKTESERQIAGLQKTISDLKQKLQLSAQEQRAGQATQPPLKRLRKF